MIPSVAMKSPTAAIAAARRTGQRHHRRLVIQETDSRFHPDDDPGCRECEEWYQRHRSCFSATCYLLSIAYLICLGTLIYLYVSRQSRNLSLELADLLAEMPSRSADCFDQARSLTPDDNEKLAEFRRLADGALTACKSDPYRSSPAVPPVELQVPSPSLLKAAQLLRLRRVDNALLLVPDRSSHEGFVAVVQGTSADIEFPDDCGKAAPVSYLSDCPAENLTVIRLFGGGCPLTHFLDSDIRLRLRLALKLLRFADELDLGVLTSRQLELSLQIEQVKQTLTLWPGTQLDDFAVDRMGRLLLINPARLRIQVATNGEGPDGCHFGGYANHATVATLLHDAYTYIPSLSVADEEVTITGDNGGQETPPRSSPPSLSRSFLRGWSNWRFARRLPPVQLPLRPEIWGHLKEGERRAEREQLYRAIEESLQSDDPVLVDLWWGIWWMSVASLVFAFLRYWLCFKFIACLEYLCQ